MLVCGGVEDHLGPPRTEGEIQTRRHADIAYDGHELEIGEPLLKFQPQIVHGGLGVVVEHQHLDSEAGKLAAELRTYGAGGARDHHGLALEVLDNLVHRNLYLLPAEQILDLDLPDPVVDKVSAHHLVYGRRKQNLHLVAHRMLNQGVLSLLRLLLGGEKQTGHIVVAGQTVKGLLVAVVKHREVRNHDMVLAVGVREETDHPVVRGIREPRCDCDRLVGGAEDEDVDAVAAADGVLLHLVIYGDHGHPDYQHEEEAYEEIQQEEGQQTGEIAGDQHQRKEHQNLLAYKGEDIFAEVPEGGMPYYDLVAPGQIEHQQGRRHGEQKPVQDEIRLGILGEEHYSHQNHNP